MATASGASWRISCRARSLLLLTTRCGPGRCLGVAHLRGWARAGAVVWRGRSGRSGSPPFGGHEIGEGDWLLAVRTGATGPHAPAEHLAVGTALLAEKAQSTGGTLLDRGRAWRARWQQGGGHLAGGLTTPEGGLATGRRAEAAPAAGREGAPAHRAARPVYRYAIVTQRGGRHAGPRGGSGALADVAGSGGGLRWATGRR